MKRILSVLIIFILCLKAAEAGNIKIGESLPTVVIEKKGQMVPEYEIKNGRMEFKEGSGIAYRKMSTNELTGRIFTVYHLAARNGIDEINQPYIDALIEANLPETLPESPYKTITFLNTSDAFWVTAGIASGRFYKGRFESVTVKRAF